VYTLLFSIIYVQTDIGSCFSSAFEKACTKLGAKYRHGCLSTP
jgi:hypothetical protein